MLTSGAASALRIRITTSGKQGKLTVPFDTSVAKFPRNASADARSSLLVAVAVAVEVAAGFGGGAVVGRDAMVGRGVTRDAAAAAGEAGRGWPTGLGEDAVLA
jgi:hypothetical protein